MINSRDDDGNFSSRSSDECPDDTMSIYSNTVIFHGFEGIVSKQNLKRALEYEMARFTDIRIVTANEQYLAFVDFFSHQDALRFLKESNNVIDFLGRQIVMNLSKRGEERAIREHKQFKSSYKISKHSEITDNNKLSTSKSEKPSSIKQSESFKQLKKEQVLSLLQPKHSERTKKEQKFSTNLFERLEKGHTSSSQQFKNSRRQRNELSTSSNLSKKSTETDVLSSIIMVSNLSHSVDKRDIRKVLDNLNFRNVDVRIIKENKMSKLDSFGFIEFYSMQEARRWMGIQKGVLRIRCHELKLRYISSREMQELMRKHDPETSRSKQTTSSTGQQGKVDKKDAADWTCLNCSSHNKKFRDRCYRCEKPQSKHKNVKITDGSEHIGATPCNTVVVRFIDALTTEAGITAAFHDAAEVKAQRIHIVRNSCFAFVELSSVANAFKFVEKLTKEDRLFEIEGKAVTVSYAKNNFNTMMKTLQPDNSSNSKASLRNKTMVNQANIEKKSTTYPVTASASQEAVAVFQLPLISPVPPLLPLPSMPFSAITATTTKYPLPNTSTFVYDASTRYYYDPMTGLLYEPNTRYFFDRVSNAYYFYDPARCIYIPASQVAATTATATTAVNKQETKQVPDKPTPKKEIGKKTKKVIFEMNRWSKRVNIKADKKPVVFSDEKRTQKKVSPTADTDSRLQQTTSKSSKPHANSRLISLTNSTDSNIDGHALGFVVKNDAKSKLEAKASAEESKLMDWSNLACRLCSRGFNDVETMSKHQHFSNLHIENVVKLRAKYGLAKKKDSKPVTVEPKAISKLIADSGAKNCTEQMIFNHAKYELKTTMKSKSTSQLAENVNSVLHFDSVRTGVNVQRVAINLDEKYEYNFNKQLDSNQKNGNNNLNDFRNEAKVQRNQVLTTVNRSSFIQPKKKYCAQLDHLRLPLLARCNDDNASLNRIKDAIDRAEKLEKSFQTSITLDSCQDRRRDFRYCDQGKDRWDKFDSVANKSSFILPEPSTAARPSFSQKSWTDDGPSSGSFSRMPTADSKYPIYVPHSSNVSRPTMEAIATDPTNDSSRLAHPVDSCSDGNYLDKTYQSRLEVPGAKRYRSPIPPEVEIKPKRAKDSDDCYERKTWCYFHRTFGSDAQQCRHPCSFSLELPNQLPELSSAIIVPQKNKQQAWVDDLRRIVLGGSSEFIIPMDKELNSDVDNHINRTSVSRSKVTGKTLDPASQLKLVIKYDKGKDQEEWCSSHEQFGKYARNCDRPCSFTYFHKSSGNRESTDEDRSGWCHYHRFFGEAARNCCEPCSFASVQKPIKKQGSKEKNGMPIQTKESSKINSSVLNEQKNS